MPELVSLESLSTVLDHPRIGIQIIGPDWRYLYVNETVARHGHSSRDALTGRTMMEAYPGIEGTPLFSVLRACMQDRQPGQLENEFTYPDGTTGWFELRVEPVSLGILVLSLDITERKRAEEQQRLPGELGALLGSILGTVARALQSAEPGSALHRDLQEIRAAAERAVVLARALVAPPEGSLN